MVYFEYQAIKNIEIEIIYRLYATADFLFIGFLCIEKQSSKLYKLTITDGTELHYLTKWQD